METKDILKEIRTKNNLTQDEMSERLFVTRQAVSRWENGDTTPNTEILKEISKKFDVSINTLLGSPRNLICQCCYTDGDFAYKSMDELLDFLSGHMSNENFTKEQAREYFSGLLPKLEHWK